MSITPEQVRRAKDLAAIASSQAYMETLQRELRSMMGGDASKELDRHTLVAIAGLHAHEAVAMDEHGNALALLCTWEIVSEPMVVAAIVERSQHDGSA